MNSIIGKSCFTRRRFLCGTASAVAATFGGYGLWRWQGESIYRSSLNDARGKINESKLLAEIVRYATLAPNSHNTQPWRFEGSFENLIIRPDTSRRCPIVDPDDHHLFVSLGCACENAVLAAAACGRHSEVTFDAMNSSLLISMEDQSPDRSDLFNAIPTRQTTRAPFDGTRLTKSELDMLKKACLQDDVEVLFYTEPRDLKKVEAFVVEANRSQLEDQAFMQELKHWMRFSYGDAVRTGDGLFGKCSNQPVLPSWIARNAVDFVLTTQSEIAKCETQLRSSSGIAVFVSKEEKAATWISVGRCFERFALQATAMGLKHSHINQPVEVSSVRPSFAEWLGIGRSRPDLVIRFGRGQSLPYSLRRPVCDVFSSDKTKVDIVETTSVTSWK